MSKLNLKYFKKYYSPKNQTWQYTLQRGAVTVYLTNWTEDMDWEWEICLGKHTVWGNDDVKSSDDCLRQAEKALDLVRSVLIVLNEKGR